MGLILADLVVLAVEVELLASRNVDLTGNGHGQGIALEDQLANIVVDVLDARSGGAVVSGVVGASGGGEEVQHTKVLAEAGGDDVFIVETGDVQISIHRDFPPSLKNIVMTYS